MKRDLDEFEPVDETAERETFSYVELPLKSAALVTDGTPQEAERLKQSIIAFMPPCKA